MYLGIDFGTSGCRACIIDDSEKILFESQQSLPAPISIDDCHYQDADIWWQALLALLYDVSQQLITEGISDICINGTSATVVNCDDTGYPLSPALMYNDLSSHSFIKDIKLLAPKNHVTLSASSALSKMMLLHHKNKKPNSFMLNQADWLSNRLCGEFATSDYNNALKMGYDVVKQTWPHWVTQLLPKNLLPHVKPPASTIGQLLPSLCKQFGFNTNVNVKLGTTDSIAAFIATGVKSSTQAVTSLGSTLVLKVLADNSIENSTFGIYSHKLGRYWLAGGASNTGGKVLFQYFNTEQLSELSCSINPNLSSGLNYYPLPSIGERFPINDRSKMAKLSPRPNDDSLFLQGLFEGIAHIEQLGYKKLAELGATYPKQIISCGGGAHNPTWQAIRQRILKSKVQPATYSQACYGSALLAKNGLTHYL